MVQKEGTGKKQSVSDLTLEKSKKFTCKDMQWRRLSNGKKIKMEKDAIVSNGDIGTNQ